MYSVRLQLARIEHEIQEADEAPTASQQDAYETASEPLAGLLDQWKQLKQNEFKSLNENLRREHLSALHLDTSPIDHGVDDQIELGDED
jgi:vacuolar-type H+-ATPase subunit H